MIAYIHGYHIIYGSFFMPEKYMHRGSMSMTNHKRY